MKKFFILLTLFISVLQAKGVIGSPEVLVNSSGNYLISIQINDLPSINEKDIKLSDFKSNDPFLDETLEYLLFEDLERFKRLTLALPATFQETYFSFRLTAGDEVSKDIFIFLPQKTSKQAPNQRISFKLPAKKIYGQPQRYDIQAALAGEQETTVTEPKKIIKSSSAGKINSSDLEPKLELTSQKISSKEIETMWSVAKSVQDNFDASIYQIMWAFYLENPNAFIDDNINLIRKDIDLALPSPELVQSTNNMDAKASIGFMSSLPRKIAPISGRQLILTAPASLLNQTDTLAAKSEDSLNSSNSQTPKPIANSNLSGSEIIKKNTSIISLNNAAPSIVPKSKTPSRAFQLTDLIWVGLLSLILGFVIAFMLIRFNKKPSFTKTAIEEDFQQDDSSIFQSNLSVSNDIEIQELDLVRTYIDMGDWNNAEIILEKLIASSTDSSILSSAKELLNQKK